MEAKIKAAWQAAEQLGECLNGNSGDKGGAIKLVSIPLSSVKEYEIQRNGVRTISILKRR